MKKLIPIFFVLFALIACTTSDALFISSEEKNRASTENKQRNQQSIDACIKAGGIPVYSIWDNRLVDCIFPPREEKK